MIAFEATEVASTSRARTLVPVRPAEPLAGAPDRGPIPLADNVQAAGPPSGRGRDARAAAGGAFEPGRAPRPGPDAAAQAGLPPGDPARVEARDAAPGGASRSSPSSSWSAAWVRGLCLRRAARRNSLGSVTAGQKALDQARADLAKVTGPGIDLVPDDPAQALELLTDAYDQLQLAAGRQGQHRRSSRRSASRSRPASTGSTASSRSPRPASTRSSRRPKAPAFDLSAMVRGPDGKPYVIDRPRRRSTGSTSRPRQPRSSPVRHEEQERDRRRRRATWASAARTC